MATVASFALCSVPTTTLTAPAARPIAVRGLVVLHCDGTQHVAEGSGGGSPTTNPNPNATSGGWSRPSSDSIRAPAAPKTLGVRQRTQERKGNVIHDKIARPSTITTTDSTTAGTSGVTAAAPATIQPTPTAPTLVILIVIITIKGTRSAMFVFAQGADPTTPDSGGIG